MIDKSFFGDLKKIQLSELSTICGFRVIGENDFCISGISILSHATSTDLSFFGNKKYLEDLKNTSAGAVIIANDNLTDLPKNVVGLICPNVMIGYAKAVDVLYPKDIHSSHICSSANIHKTAEIGANCYIGDHVSIGENAKIGDDVVIENNTVIGKSCRIGSGCRIRNNVSISYSIIGKNVLINSGARIGESGFGIIPSGKEMIYIKQLGRVIIGDRVRIGANTTIDRGSVEDTTIGNDTIIDNLVQIGHNVTIGERSIIVAQVGIAGSTKIGNDVVLAGQVGVAGHIEIEDRVIAAAKSGIAASIKTGQVVGGIPAVDIGIWKRQAAFLKISVTKKNNRNDNGDKK
ncbi:MAG: UDP-3-O-(3-hydroxymyristoyl)glucosamine N-acyltransferase [Holosporaceae bacterium]|jgi:UDP-3-O-[3-hydroxymyristoyl] glucosamine N-acyltransferase|nr:UDP-3-O-(3-hydroxymyristoyl)glucosamine N-acyltransferase [Holosporaceae bacterium]